MAGGTVEEITLQYSVNIYWDYSMHPHDTTY